MGFFSSDPPLTVEERTQRQEHAHAERMKLIELGQPLPEVEIARAKAVETQARMDTIRANVMSIFSAIGPAAILGVATGATAAILHLGSTSVQLVLVIVIWISAVLISSGSIVASVVRHQRMNFPRLLREYLTQLTEPKIDAPPAERKPATQRNPVELTPQEVERLSRAIQP